MNQSVDVIGDNQLLNNSDAVASTPEPSSAFGVLAIGVVLLAAMVKRGWVSLLK